VLAEVQSLSSETIWLAGSSLRNSILGLSNSFTGNHDIDLIFFNKHEVSKQYEKDIESMLIERTGLKNLSVKNEARLTAISDGLAYNNIQQCIDSFPDVTIALGAKISAREKRGVSFYAPYGLSWAKHRVIAPLFAS
jgi:hypothetical protein